MTKREILITAGPTREPMDPVRHLSNASSGLMGIEMARALRKQGADVVLVMGPTSLKVPRFLPVIPVTTAREMSRRVKKLLPACDAFIATAAVSDWRFEKIHKTKLKKKSLASLRIRLVRNPDILKEAGRAKGMKKKPLLVGFALETGNLRREALSKIKDKNLDLIVANKPESFSSPFINAVLIDRTGRVRRYGKTTKKSLSEKIGRWIGQKLNEA